MSYGSRSRSYGGDEHPFTSELREAARDARNHGETASKPVGSRSTVPMSTLSADPCPPQSAADAQ